MRKILFTKIACNKCREVIDMLTMRGAVENIDMQSNIEIANEVGIHSTPSLVITRESGNHIYIGNEQILMYLNNN